MKKFFAAATALLSLSLYGLDTTENLSKGNTDLGIYTNFSGIDTDQKSVGFEACLGYGITDYLTAYVGIGETATDKLLQPEGYGSYRYAQLISTVLNSDHLDIDLTFTMASGMTLTPAIEINYDIEPDMAFAGLYSKVQHNIMGEGSEAGKDDRLLNATNVAFGAYYAPTENLQLLVQYDMTFNHTDVDGVRDLDIGSIAVGANYCINDNIELIVDFGADIPQDDEDIAYTAGVAAFFTISK